MRPCIITYDGNNVGKKIDFVPTSKRSWVAKGGFEPMSSVTCIENSMFLYTLAPSRIDVSHNSRFTALMDQYMPKYRGEMNRLPVRHEDWIY